MFTLFSTVLPLMFFHSAECHHEMIVRCSKVLLSFSATTRQHSDVGEMYYYRISVSDSADTERELVSTVHAS